jgi:polysaccharide biosynthesis transport protein
MLQFSRPPGDQGGFQAYGQEQGSVPAFSPLEFLGRQWRVILLGLVPALAAAVFFLAMATPRYTATAQMFISPQQAVPQAVATQLDATSAAVFVEDQLEVLKSETLAERVVRNLELWKDREFVGDPKPEQGASGPSGWIRQLMRTVGLAGPDSGPPTEDDLVGSAVDTFTRKLKVRRVGLTSVVNVSFESNTPDKAIRIANGVVDAYTEVELEAKVLVAQRATALLQDRINVLRDQAMKAAQAVEEFKIKNGLVGTGRTSLEEQQLAQLSSQLLNSHSAAAEAKARLERVTGVIEAGGVPDAGIADVLRNETLSRLRQQYQELQTREADWTGKYGADYGPAASLREQIEQIRKNIQTELRRSQEIAQSEYDIARRNEQMLQSSVDDLVKKQEKSNQAQVKMRELESNAQVTMNLYNSFQQQYMDTSQRQQMPFGNARLLTAAKSADKTYPVPSLVLGSAVIAGLMLGLAAGVARELFDPSFRTTAQVNAIVRREVLGILPAEKSRRLPRPSAHPSFAFSERRGRSQLMDVVLRAPFSRFTETIRRIKVAVELGVHGKSKRVIGVVSALPQEGKTTVAMNLALLLTQSSKKVLAIDADLRHPTLTSAVEFGLEFTPSPLEDILARKVPVEKAIYTDIATGLNILPAMTLNASHPTDLISSPEMSQLIADLRQHYDYIVLDFPPIGPTVDAKAASHLVDAFIFVLRWGHTPRGVVANALGSARPILDKLIGVVINRVDLSAFQRIEGAGAEYYTNEYQKLHSNV